MSRQVWTATRASLTHLDRNEDNLWVAENRQAAAVIDGMGGYRRRTPQGEIGGEHASTLAAKVLGEFLEGLPPELTLNEAKARAREAIVAANTRIFEELNLRGSFSPAELNSDQRPEEALVGCALTLAILCDNDSRIVMAQHGDTRGYVLKADGIFLVTEDQDRVSWDVAHNVLSQEQAAEINAMMDQFDGVDVSIMTELSMRYLLDKNIFGELGDHDEAPETVFSVLRVEPGDRLALISDGVHGNLTITELERLIGYPDDPAQIIIDMSWQRCEMPRFPDPSEPTKPYNMRSTQDDMTVIVMQL